MRQPQLAPPQPCSALIFDFDGTLADTMPGHFVSWQATLRRFGADLSEARFYSLAGVPAAEIIELLNREHGYGLDVEHTRAERERHYAESNPLIEEIAMVADVARAYAHLPMAVATGNLRSVVEPVLTALGLRKLFKVLIAAEDVTRGKPDPEVFLLAAEQLGVPPSECVVYEDADLGIEAARRAGMRWVDVRPFLA